MKSKRTLTLDDNVGWDLLRGEEVQEKKIPREILTHCKPLNRQQRSQTESSISNQTQTRDKFLKLPSLQQSSFCSFKTTRSNRK